MNAAEKAAGDPEMLSQIAHWVARGIEVVGIAVIVVGAIVATGFFLRELNRRAGFSRA